MQLVLIYCALILAARRSEIEREAGLKSEKGSPRQTVSGRARQLERPSWGPN